MEVKGDGDGSGGGGGGGGGGGYRGSHTMQIHINVEVAFIIQCYSPYAKSVASFTTF